MLPESLDSATLTSESNNNKIHLVIPQLNEHEVDDDDDVAAKTLSPAMVQQFMVLSTVACVLM